MAANDTAIALDALTKNYGARTAVNGLSFSVAAGTVCGFIGPNGAGKTTTIRMLLGLIAPSSGTATVLGKPISDPTSYLGRVGAMIEGPAFTPGLSGRQNLEVLARLGGIPRSRIDWAVGQVGLGKRARDPFRSYSLGMKQRLGIAAALLPDPDLLVLDEPTNGLDPDGIREVRVLLRSLADQGKTVFVSSHLLEELEQICDELVIIRNGELLFAGSMGELASAQRPELIAVPEHPESLLQLANLCADAGHPADILDGRVHIQAPASWAAELNRNAMSADITLIQLASTAPSLQETYFELTQETAR